MLRLGRALFVNPFTILLGIDTGAAGKQQRGTNEPVQEVLDAVDINLSVTFGITSRRTRTVHNQVKILRPGVDLLPVAQIDRGYRIRFVQQLRG